MADVMKRLRQKPPALFGDMRCVASEDLSQKSFQGDPKFRIGENLPASDVLIYTLEDNSRIIVRPSGTEPKVKVYLMLSPNEKPAQNLHEKKDLMNQRIERCKLFIGGLF
jgi:phosphomannomutase